MNNSLPLKTIRVTSGSARGISPACASRVFSSKKHQNLLTSTRNSTQRGKTCRFAPSLAAPSPGMMAGWFWGGNQTPFQQGETREQLHACTGAKGEGKRHVCLQYVCPLRVFIPNTCFFIYAKHVSSVFRLLDFILKCSIFMAWRDKDMRREGKVIQKAIKSGVWLL